EGGAGVAARGGARAGGGAAPPRGGGGDQEGGNARGGALGRPRPRRSVGDEDGGLEFSKLVGQIGEPRRAARGPAILEDDGLALDVAEVAEATAERVEPARRVLCGAKAEEGDAGRLRGLPSRHSGSGEGARAEDGQQVTAGDHRAAPRAIAFEGVMKM